ncbi:Cytochrome c-type biogenesis protein DsbD [Chitinispirillum alkaliphilum]|nr:Cytochrome c-type biogenesis protein DsbD [Chitinispirillum alkaliphilum]
MLEVEIPPQHYLYANPLGPGIGKPLQISIEQHDGIEWSELRKEEATRFDPPVGDWVWAYKKEAHFLFAGVITPQQEESIESKVYIDGLICLESCIPVFAEEKFSVTLNPASSFAPFSAIPQGSSFLPKLQPMDFTIREVGYDLAENSLSTLPFAPEQPIDDIDFLGQIGTAEGGVSEWNYRPTEEKKDYNLWLALLFSFIAGVFFNVTPCVFPLLGMKTLSLSQSTKNSKREIIIRSLVFSSGIIAVFLLLATLAGFAGFSWGEQFQNPNILTAIVILVFLFSLGLFDMYTILLPSSVSNLNQKSQKKGMAGDFLGGMMATVLATPCGGPFLGAVLAWSLLQPPSVIYVIFLSMGVGMALPYVIISSSRRVMKLLPKPGKWMQDVKYAMGFLLLGFSIYLMIGLPSERILGTVAVCASLTLAIAIQKRFAPFGTHLRKKLFVGAITLSICAASIAIFIRPTSAVIGQTSGGSYGNDWVDFSPALLRLAHEEGRNVVLNFTAAWCMNCRYNDITVLQTREVRKLFAEKDAVLLRADITGHNPEARELLEHLGSRSIPFLAIFPADNPKRPVIMRDIFSRRELIDQLRQL